MRLANLLVLVGITMFTAVILGVIIVVLRARASKATATHEAQMGQGNAGVAHIGSGKGKGSSRPPMLSPQERARRKAMLERTHLPGSPTPDVPTTNSRRPSVAPTEMGEQR